MITHLTCGKGDPATAVVPEALRLAGDGVCWPQPIPIESCVGSTAGVLSVYQVCLL